MLNAINPTLSIQIESICQSLLLSSSSTTRDFRIETSQVNEAHNHSTTSPSESIFERNNYAQKQQFKMWNIRTNNK
jgi:hypothetical protein